MSRSSCAFVYTTHRWTCFSETLRSFVTSQKEGWRKNSHPLCCQTQPPSSHELNQHIAFHIFTTWVHSFFLEHLFLRCARPAPGARTCTAVASSLGFAVKTSSKTGETQLETLGGVLHLSLLPAYGSRQYSWHLAIESLFERTSSCWRLRTFSWLSLQGNIITKNYSYARCV